MDKPPLAEQQASNDDSVIQRAVVPIQQFLADVNGGARVFDYRVFCGVEPVGGEDSAIGIVIALNYEVIAEGAPEAPEMLGADLFVTKEYWDWHAKYVVKRECHMTVEPGEG